jgi:hypothetical protein
MRVSFLLQYSLATIFDHGGPPPRPREFVPDFTIPLDLDDLADIPLT